MTEETPKVVGLNRKAFEPATVAEPEVQKIDFPDFSCISEFMKVKMTTLIVMAMDEDGNIGTYRETLRMNDNEAIALMAIYHANYLAQRIGLK